VRGLFRFINGVFVICLFVFVCTVIWILYDGFSDQGDRAEIAVVPGNQVASDGTPGPTLAARLDGAITLYNQGRFPLIFVSGAVEPGGADEAQVMAKYLESHNIPESAIIVDSKGVNTAATARGLAAAMKWRDIHSAMIVTHYYHISRMKLAMQEAGITSIGQFHVGSIQKEDAYHIAREAVAFHVYWIRFYLIPEAKDLEEKAKEDAPKVKQEIQNDTDKAKDAVQQNLNSLQK